ncbi:hypothetical protein DXJ76_24180 [Vibrio parahaemolyticus]|nr:hypothetical protein DXJ76_24180 [Vibrio parahaemolyticus]
MRPVQKKMTIQQPSPVTEQSLIQDIANIIGQYRSGTISTTYDTHHVSRWVNQFQPHEKFLVLEETKRLLRGNYISESIFDLFIDSLYPYLVNVKQFSWSDISLLSIQQGGNSQTTMVNKLTHSMLYKHSLYTRINDLQANIFIYLDDFIFSGGRILQDLRAWIANSAPQVCTLLVATIGYFNYGQHYVQRKLNELIKNSNKSIQLQFVKYDTSFTKENRFFLKDDSEVFWPMVSATQIPEVVSYLASQDRPFSFRQPSNNPNRTFSSSRRELYENILLKYGLQIISYSVAPSPYLKPLGFDTFDGLGFGSTVFTYRNCPNNCPLVFWWGDPNAPSYSPLSRWYPLLQRDTYN